MNLRGRHPTVALVSSGILITVALLPMYLGQLESFHSSIGNALRLAGLGLAVIAFVFGSWSILNHSGRLKKAGDNDEPGATETWLKAVDLVWKFAAAIAVIVTTNWFAVVLREEQVRKQQAEVVAVKAQEKAQAEVASARSRAEAVAAEAANEVKKARDEKAKADSEKTAQAEAQAARARENVVQLLVNADPYIRLVAVANGRDLVSVHLPLSLSVAETLFTVAIRDTDEGVREAAATCLPVGILGVAEKYDFSKAVLELASKRIAETSSLGSNSEGSVDARLLEALNTVQQFSTDSNNQTAAGELASKLSQGDLPAAASANDLYQRQPHASQQASIDSFAATVIQTAANSNDPNNLGEAGKVLQNTSADAVKASIQNLPEALVLKLPPRAYLHIAGETQRAKARVWQTSLSSEGYITPGIQNVAGKGYIPDTLEVRYFDESSKARAEAILDVLKAHGAKDGRVSYVIPTANDLRISPDIKSHFEIWSGRNSF